MNIRQFTSFEHLEKAGYLDAFQAFVRQAPTANFFQSPEFLPFIGAVKGYKPFLLLAQNNSGQVEGSLAGVVQSDGNGMKAWLSRRAIIWGGPLVADASTEQGLNVARQLLEALKQGLQGKAIFIEFRNFFDCAPLHSVFEAAGFSFRPHLNFIVKLDDPDAVQSRLSSNRRRQIRASLKAGAVTSEPESEDDVLELYALLAKLYKEKVKKPLPSLDLFMQFWKSPSAKTFLVKYDGKVVGGSVGPIYANKILYQWYVCGENGAIKGVHPSVLASWAPMEYGLKNGYQYFDFMGAGRPDDNYGVRDFKARFGGDEVCYGRYEMVLNPALFRVGKLGLKIYQTIR
jgi:hypothetical protein